MSQGEPTALHLEVLEGSLALLTIDQPNSRANTLGQGVQADLERVLGELDATTAAHRWGADRHRNDLLRRAGQRRASPADWPRLRCGAGRAAAGRGAAHPRMGAREWGVAGSTAAQASADRPDGGAALLHL